MKVVLLLQLTLYGGQILQSQLIYEDDVVSEMAHLELTLTAPVQLSNRHVLPI